MPYPVLKLMPYIDNYYFFAFSTGLATDSALSSACTRAFTDSAVTYHFSLDMWSPTSLDIVCRSSTPPTRVPPDDVLPFFFADKEGSFGVRIESALAVKRVSVSPLLDLQGPVCGWPADFFAFFFPDAQRIRWCRVARIREVDLCAYPVEDGQRESVDEGGEGVD
jgi:hypothetical protein